MSIAFFRKSSPGLWGALTIAALILAACQPAGSSQATAASTSIPVTGPTSGLPTEPAVPVATAPAAAAPSLGVTPAVTVADQAVKDSTVVIDDVVSQGPGWMVIHADDNGKPGPVILGYAAVKDGDNKNVIVNVGGQESTPVVYAMLHVDAGAVGTYEFPGPDVPAMLNGDMVSPPFHLTGGTSASSDGSNGAGTPAQVKVDVTDQAVQNGTVTVNGVDSAGPGWLVIHIDDQGNPGEVIGFAPVKEGHTASLAVTVDPAKATPVLYAMLHVDAGTVGKYEFPGPDKPVLVNGQMVSPAFHVSGTAAGQSAPTAAVPTAAAPAPSTSPVQVLAADNPKLGKILVDAKGMTLYLFKKDPPGQTVCTGGCAENWPPLLIDSGKPVAGDGVTGKLGVIARPDNGIQVTYNDIPLYYFVGDEAPGDVNGQGLGEVWFVLNP